MSIWVNSESKIVVQGLTGNQGSFHAKQCIEYGTQIVAGVTPGRGGETHLDVPVFNTMDEAVAATGRCRLGTALAHEAQAVLADGDDDVAVDVELAADLEHLEGVIHLGIAAPLVPLVDRVDTDGDRQLAARGLLHLLEELPVEDLVNPREFEVLG